MCPDSMRGSVGGVIRPVSAPVRVGVQLALLAGAGLVAVILRPPRVVIRGVSRVRRDVTFDLPQSSRRLALSFDDGPDRVVTPQLLDTLSHHGVRATFFFIGSQAEVAGDVIGRVISDGHEIGNHLWRDERAAGLSEAEFECRLLCTRDALGVPSRLFRPGGGWIGRRKTAIAARNGYRCVLGSIYPFDAQVGLRPRIVADVARRARPGSIIVLHEGRPDRGGVVRVVDDLLARLRATGYEVVPVSELFNGERLPGVADQHEDSYGDHRAMHDLGGNPAGRLGHTVSARCAAILREVLHRRRNHLVEDRREHAPEPEH
jgi:peptidoglycan-N-acetylglucosamine deacetylase